MINMQLHHPSKLVTECSCMSQQQSPPRPTGSQDLLVGRIALYACIRMGLTYKPQKAAICVSLNRLRPCPVEIVNRECTSVGASPTLPVDSTTPRTKDSISESSLAEDTAWTSRLLPRQSSDGDAKSKNGNI